MVEDSKDSGRRAAGAGFFALDRGMVPSCEGAGDDGEDGVGDARSYEGEVG